MREEILSVYRGYVPKPPQGGAFILKSPYCPAGDQPQAIEALVKGLSEAQHNQLLLGVTGSGKTFTMANIIEKTQRPSLILAPNKTLAFQLYSEMKSFFPENAVEYFVSYYDYYRPEAYMPSKDVFLEKESSINPDIDRHRHSATRALLERRDVIVVASVSCIYGLGAIESYQGLSFPIETHQKLNREDFLRKLISLQYARNDIDFRRGTFRVRGERVDVFPAHCIDRAWRFSFCEDAIESIDEIESLSGKKTVRLPCVVLYPNHHYVTPGPTLQQAIEKIRLELQAQYAVFQAQGKLLEAQRLHERVSYDLESLASLGMCAGIENYSCYLSGRPIGQPPPTLFEYLPRNALLFVDESHVTIPQIRGMSLGDTSRKLTLADYGFRLPSCRHNRPLTFEEWDQLRPDTLFISATPGPWEIEKSPVVVPQIIRPTGLLDPVCCVHPSEGQIAHLTQEIQKTIAQSGRILVTTLTKKMAEDLSEYFTEQGFKARYMHADIDTLERVALIQELRQGLFDILVGINLLREGLDIPECQLVAILDADKQGYLRSKTALIQTIGRAARHLNGHVVLYAHIMSPALKGALEETDRRRQIQKRYNTEHGIVPQSVDSPIWAHQDPFQEELEAQPDKILFERMKQKAKNLNFEEASKIKDILKKRGFIKT